MYRRTFLRGAVGLGATAALPIMARAHPIPASGITPVWRQLFDGSLNGWDFFQDGVGHVDHNRAVTVNDGELHFLGQDYSGGDTAPFGHLVTQEEFANYHLRFQYRWGHLRYKPRALAKRNSGLLYHFHPRNNMVWPESIEFQLQESDVGDVVTLGTQAIPGPSLGGTPAWPDMPPSFPRTYPTPSVAGGIARQWYRRDGYFEREGEWNTIDLYAFEDQAAHFVNGRIVNSIYGIRWDRARGDGSYVPLTSGRIALEIEAAEISFRDLKIRPITRDDLTATYPD